MRIKTVAGIVALTLTSLVAAGCGGGPPPPPGLDAVQGMSSDQAWQSGFADAMAGDASAVTGSAAYQAGYQAGADYKVHPSPTPPNNPYKSPAGNQPPSATGGG